MKNWGISSFHFIICHIAKLESSEIEKVLRRELADKCFGAYLDVRACRGIIKCERGVRIHNIEFHDRLVKILKAVIYCFFSQRNQVQTTCYWILHFKFIIEMEGAGVAFSTHFFSYFIFFVFFNLYKSKIISFIY